MSKLNLAVRISAALSMGFCAMAFGQTAINNAAINAGGITLGDAAGYPASINSSGSYKLTGAVTGGSGFQGAIEINADNVSLDLAGFVINGQWANCTPNGGTPGNNCTATSGQNALIKVNGKNARIYNGSVVNGAGSGISGNGGSIHLDHVYVGNNHEYGIYMTGDGHELADVISEQNARDGIYLGQGSRLDNVRSTANNGAGVWTFSNAAANQVVVTKNSGHGAYMDSSVVNHLTAASNGLDGFIGASVVTASKAISNGQNGFESISLITSSSSSYNGGRGFVMAVDGCYAQLQASGNTLSPAVNGGTALVGSVTVCP